MKRERDKFGILDFVLDRSFIHWVRSRDLENEQVWTEWLINHPEMENKIETARSLLLALQFKGEQISSQQINAEWEKLYGKICAGPSTHSANRMYYLPRKGWLSVTVVLLLLITLALIARWLINEFFSNDLLGSYTSATMPAPTLSVLHEEPSFDTIYDDHTPLQMQAISNAVLNHPVRHGHLQETTCCLPSGFIDTELKNEKYSFTKM